MAVLTRKQREIQLREQQILSCARRILVEEGYPSLTMDRLAKELEYAKGTLYNHFPNKEEIVAALAIESLELRRSLIEKAALLAATSRVRMLAIGAACEVYAVRFEQHFAVEQMLRYAVIWEKSSQKRQELVRNCEMRTMSIVAGVTRDAVAAADLDIPKELTAEELVFGFWSLTYGSHLLNASSPSLHAIGIRNAQDSIRYHAWTLMNGFGWKPSLTFEQTHRLMDELAEKVSVDA